MSIAAMKWIIVCLPLIGCSQQSCESGQRMQDGWYTVVVPIGGGLYPLQHPRYVCKVEDKK